MLFESDRLARSARELFVAPVAQWPPAGVEPELGVASFARFVSHAIAADSVEEAQLAAIRLY